MNFKSKLLQLQKKGMSKISKQSSQKHCKWKTTTLQETVKDGNVKFLLFWIMIGQQE